ncbi:MAG: glutathione S-transferase family protein [Pseudomonadota bacterium]
MTTTDFKSVIRAANQQLGNNRRNRDIGRCPPEGPRFELYHSAPSLCSHKVRTVLAEKDIPYRSHDLNIMPAGKSIPENYRPTYVRMRLLGGDDKGYATGYTGQSSVTSEGLDPCVVPTLVDHEKERVIVDSSRICNYLDSETSTGTQLVPDHLADEIAAQIDTIDRAPHVAILYGANPAGDRRPRGLQIGITGVQDKKIRTLNAMIAELAPDDPIIEAYKSKISKEAGSRTFVGDPDSMRRAYAEMEAHADALEAKLATHDGPWALGKDYTMADIMWTVSLYRLKWLGLADTWESSDKRSRVATYVERAFQRPSFQFAVINWPFAYAPSPHVEEMDTFGAKLRFFGQLLTRRNWLEYHFG